MKFAKPQGRMAKVPGALSLLAVLAGSLAAGQAAAVPTRAPVTGEIERIHLDDPTDHWSGGHIVVSGKTIIIPRNLLLDLPANRLTLKQLFDQAPAACVAAGETGLAKSDTCNHTGFGSIAAISANKTNGGNIIAGDILISKGEEAITGRITYINHDEGYIRLNGVPGDATTGVMARMNDPTNRHTVQKGLGCAADSASVNCSPDPRFALDTDNYTNASSTGFPTCIPSTTPRTWAGLPAQSIAGRPVTDASPEVVGGTTASDASGVGDELCPSTNRTADLTVADSRRFAPIKLDDNIELEGNWETIDGVKFLSYHTSTLMVALATKTALTQPDYLMPEEVFVETGDFQNFRARSLIIGFSTLLPDILLHSIHYDPTTNSKHLKPLATTAGCDAVAGVGTCSQAGLLGALNLGPAGGNIFRIRYDVDFIIGARAGLDPCAMLRADPRMYAGGPTPCPNWTVTGRPALYNATTIAEMFAVLSPTPHEVQFYTGHHYAAEAAGFTHTTVDIMGNEATSGQYLFPFGVNLGGVEWSAEWSEINLAAFQTPFAFSAIPWNLDRRLSPNGCLRDANDVAQCESTPQPLDPFPFEDMDPRTQTVGCAALAGSVCELPDVPYNDPMFTASGLTTVRNRILSYIGDVPATATKPAHQDFNGDATVLAWPPTDPAAFPEPAEEPLTFCGSTLALGCNGTTPQVAYTAPVAVATGPLTAVNAGASVTLSGTQSTDGNNPALPLLYAWAQTAGPTVLLSGAATATPSFTAPIGAADTILGFVLTVSNGQMTNTASVNVNVNAVTAPTAAASATPATVNAGSTVTLSSAGSADTNSPAVLALTYAWSKVSPATPNVTLSSATAASPTFTAPPVATQTVFTFQNTVSNGYKTAAATTTVTVDPSAPTVTVNSPTVGTGVFTTLTANATTVAGQALTYSWRQVSGTTVSFTGGSTRALSFTAPATTGTLVFEVTVTDSVGLTAKVQSTVTVSSDIVRAAAIYYSSQKKVTVWMNSNSSTLRSMTATFPDADKTWTQTKTEALNITTIGSQNCNAGLTNPTVTKCAIAYLIGTSAIPTAGTGTADAPVGTWVTVSSAAGGSVKVPMQIAP